MRSTLILTFSILVLWSCSQQPNTLDLRENADSLKITLPENPRHVQKYPFDTLDYVGTLLYTWKLAKVDPNAFSSHILLQLLSYVGDNQSILKYSSTTLAPYPQLNDTAYLNGFKKKPFRYINARRCIIDSFRNHSTIMFNEAHDRPQTRAFLVSLLSTLREAGATHLAFETLIEDGNLKSIDGSTGILTQEPMGGELVRTALSLGFTLVPYEDQEHGHTSNQRDSVQAANLFRRIKTKDGIHKTVVLAGYGHICEKPIDTYTSMAMNFKRIAGVDPFTVEQTLLLEAMEPSAYANRLLDKVTQSDSALGFTSGAYRFGVDTDAYDIFIYNPPTKYFHNRPTWLLTTPEKQFTSVEIPETLRPVLVQAYTAEEISTNRDYFTRIPADQTFYSENGKVWFCLLKNKNYKVVFRGEQNEILMVKDLKS